MLPRHCYPHNFKSKNAGGGGVDNADDGHLGLLLSGRSASTLLILRPVSGGL